MAKPLAFPERPPLLKSDEYGEMFPDRVYVLRADMSWTEDDVPWMVFRGDDTLHEAATHAEAMDWALRAAWGVEVPR